MVREVGRQGAGGFQLDGEIQKAVILRGKKTLPKPVIFSGGEHHGRLEWLEILSSESQSSSETSGCFPRLSPFGSFLIYGTKLRTELPSSAAITFLLNLHMSTQNQETLMLGKIEGRRRG